MDAFMKTSDRGRHQSDVSNSLRSLMLSGKGFLKTKREVPPSGSLSRSPHSQALPRAFLSSSIDPSLIPRLEITVFQLPDPPWSLIS